MVAHFVGTIFWICIIGIPVSLIWGVWKKSAISLFVGGVCASFIYVYICVMNEGPQFIIIAPLLFFLLSFFLHKKTN